MVQSHGCETNLKNCHRTISVLVFALLGIGQQLYLRKYLQEKCTLELKNTTNYIKLLYKYIQDAYHESYQ